MNIAKGSHTVLYDRPFCFSAKSSPALPSQPLIMPWLMESSPEGFRLHYVDHGLRVSLQDLPRYDLGFRAGYHAVQQGLRLLRVHARRRDLRCTVVHRHHDLQIDLIRQLRHDEHGDLVVFLVQQVDHLCRCELEYDGVECLVPAEHQARQDQHCRIAHQDEIPDVPVFLFQKIYGDKIRSAGGRSPDQAEADGCAVDQSAEHANQQDILGDGHGRNDIGEHAGGYNDQRRIDGEPLADSPETENRRNSVQC